MRTAVFDTIKSIQPYFFSLREIGTAGSDPIVSLDIKIPISWKFESIIEGITAKVQDKNDSVKLLSLAAPNTKEGYDKVFTVAKKIIKSNQEEEEKIRLFNATVDGLKDLFMNSSLDKLKELSFIKDGVRNKKGTGETTLGDTEGQGANGETQTEAN